MNNNGEYRIVRSAFTKFLAVPFWTKPGFAIPLFQTSNNSNAKYFQIVDKGRRISSFEICNSLGNCLPLDFPVAAQVGEPEIFGIVGVDGEAYAGTREDLSKVILNWIHFIESPVIRLNFALFSEDTDTARSTASEVMRLKSKEFGDENRAGRWLVSSFLMPRIASIYEASHYQKRNPNNLLNWSIMGTENALSIIINRDEISSIKLIFSSHRMHELVNLFIDATGFNISIVSSEARNKRLSIDMRQVDSEIRNLMRIGRQEGRVAYFIRVLLTNFPVAVKLSQLYSDKAAFARRSISLIRSRLRLSTGKNISEIEIAKEIYNVFKEAHPFQRGVLLMEMATHLYEFRLVSQSIRDLTNRSNARVVSEMRRDILRELDRDRRPM